MQRGPFTDLYNYDEGRVNSLLLGLSASPTGNYRLCGSVRGVGIRIGEEEEGGGGLGVFIGTNCSFINAVNFKEDFTN